MEQTGGAQTKAASQRAQDKSSPERRWVYDQMRKAEPGAQFDDSSSVTPEFVRWSYLTYQMGIDGVKKRPVIVDFDDMTVGKLIAALESKD